MIDKILRTLAEKGEVKAADLKLAPAAAKKQALASLLAESSIAVRRQGRSEFVSLTDSGRERAAGLPPIAAAPRAARARPAASAQLDRIEAALARIEARLGAAAAGSTDLKPLLVEVIAELDAAHRYGGLVPLPDLRQELRRRNVAASDGVVNAALEELERDFVIDLSIAQSPTVVTDRAAGIERPGRGLAYYVLRRQA